MCASKRHDNREYQTNDIRFNRWSNFAFSFIPCTRREHSRDDTEPNTKFQSCLIIQENSYSAEPPEVEDDAATRTKNPYLHRVAAPPDFSGSVQIAAPEKNSSIMSASSKEELIKNILGRAESYLPFLATPLRIARQFEAATTGENSELDFDVDPFSNEYKATFEYRF